jgi:hypothetical protein
MATATCEKCGKAYRVPDAARAYRCRACGGSVRAGAATGAADKPAAAEGAQGLACPSCGAPNSPGARFCEGCGARLGPDGDASRRSAREEAERTLAGRELGKALRAIQAVRMFYVANAMVSGIFLAMFLFAFAAGNVEADNETLANVLVAFYSGFLLVCLIGIWQVVAQPFFWSVLIASIWTLLKAIDLAIYGPASLLSLGTLWTAGTWVAVAATAPVRRLLREYPDLRISKRLKGQRPSVQRGDVVTRAKEKARESRARDRRQRLVFGAIAAGLMIAVFAGLQYWQSAGSGSSRSTASPPPLEPVIDLFATAWNDGGLDEVTRFFPETSRQKLGRQFGAVLTKRGWDERRPEIGPATIVASSRRRRKATHPISGSADAQLTTIWEAQGGTWVLVSVRPPKP